MKSLRLALAQINPTVGALEANAQKVIDYIQRARDEGASLVAFPEMALTGYPPEDLLLKPKFIEDNLEAIGEVAAHTQGICAVVGFVHRRDDIFNAAAVLCDGQLVDVYHKVYLPNYGVFDEMRYFQAGGRIPLYDAQGVRFGVNICEDIWYPEGPTRAQALKGAELVVNINASPYTVGKGGFRQRMLSTRASDSAVVVAYVNMVGGQDELVFDGSSMVFSERGELLAMARAFEEELLVLDVDLEAVFMWRLHDPRRRQQSRALAEPVEVVSLPVAFREAPGPPCRGCIPEALEPLEEVYKALVLGVRDYVQKNGFKAVVMGLSGGIDSALVAAIAADALGPQRVHCLFMPSPYTSQESTEDAHQVARNLGLKLVELPIDDIFQGYLERLRGPFQGLQPDTTEENIQARIRGNLLMAFSNKFGWLVLTTGNKSEMSVGYATLYGDMAGGFAVLKDVPKMMVYELARWRNGKAGFDLIPKRVLEKEPSAELKPGQHDTDTLPPYPVLDPILKAYVEEDRSFEEILTLGCEPECAQKVIAMVDRSEYKRRQAPPGIKITPRAFGRDRRFPITNHYRDF